MDRPVLPIFPAPTEAQVEATRRIPDPLTSLQREELRRRNMDALHTPIVGETPEARALEDARLANLAERTRLESLQ